MYITYKISKLNNSNIEELKDYVSVEEHLEMRLKYKANNKWLIQNISITMRTPGNDDDLLRGFLYNEGIIGNMNEIDSIKHQGDISGDYNLKNIIKGDQKIPEISAASIVAKVSRDRLVSKMSIKFKKYFWDKNFGYGTKNHIRAIKKFGITKYHRRTFQPVHNILSIR